MKFETFEKAEELVKIIANLSKQKKVLEHADRIRIDNSRTPLELTIHKNEADFKVIKTIALASINEKLEKCEAEFEKLQDNNVEVENEQH